MHGFYLLKTSENLKVFSFQGTEKGYIGNKWVKFSLCLMTLFDNYPPVPYPVWRLLDNRVWSYTLTLVSTLSVNTFDHRKTYKWQNE